MQMSDDILKRLKKYHSLLLKWQPKINLISNNTMDEAWERHFEDSLQLLDILPNEPKTIFDLGAGAGFPSLVLAITNQKYNVHLIESDQKKCSFLKTVSRETNTEAQVVNERIENVSCETIPDIITARALASLDLLFDYCAKWIEKNPQIQLIFMKGEQAEAEMQSLGTNWAFNCRTYQSKTNENAKILVFTDICQKQIKVNKK
jgi:16S rRNA (guanine527-N7)-methyltransferase